MEIKQSEDGTWRWRITEDEMWQGGYATKQQAFNAMQIALAERGIAYVSS